MQPKHAIAGAAVIGVIVILMAVLLFVPRHPAVKPPAIPAAAKLHRPAPRLALTAPPVGLPPEDLPPANAAERLKRLMEGGEAPRLRPDQVDAFLAERHRSAEALLAAAQATGDKAFLREAMEKFPNDPRVAYAAYYQSGPYDNTQPAPPERRRWLDTFKQSDPDNALPNYLAARDDFRAGRTDAAVGEILAAVGKPMRDYALDSIQNREEAYRAAGLPEAEAKVTAASEQILPQLSELKRLGQDLMDLANAYRQAGDAASADAAIQAAVNLGQEVGRSGPFLINDLVAVAIEVNALKAMDPTTPYGDGGQTIQGRLDELQQQREAMKTAGKQVEALLLTLSDAEVSIYFDRVKLFGDWEASQWLIKTRGGH